MFVDNDLHIQMAIEKQCALAGSVTAFAKKLGLAYNAVNKWRKGKTLEIRNENFKILYPFIKNDLPYNHITHKTFGNKNNEFTIDKSLEPELRRINLLIRTADSEIKKKAALKKIDELLPVIFDIINGDKK